MPDHKVPLNTPHDTGYKYLLSSKRAFVQLLKSFIEAGWTEQIEEASLVKLDKSFILPDFRNQEADLVYQATLQERSFVFYLLMELQSTVDFLMPYRLFLYLHEIWRDAFRNTPRKVRERKHFRLPMIVPIVLYNGRAAWTAPLNFREMLDGHELFTGLSVSCPYTLLSVHSYHQDDLLALSNLIGSVFLLDQATNLSEIIHRLHLLLNTIRQLSEEEFQLFTTWAKHILSRDIPPDRQAQITQVLSHTHPEEVESMISNVERVLK